MTRADRSTIVGVATGTPDGGVAIVRVSGPRARALGRALAGDLPPPRTLGRRRLELAGGFEDALVVEMPGPRSFTGEDVVELHVHGGRVNVEQVVEALLARGAVAAGPGEFTRRAFDAGRMTLDQAEGLAALVGAQTEAGLAQARRLVAGELGARVSTITGALAELRTEVEANLDFPEDVEAGDVSRWAEEVARLRGEVLGWLRGFEAGRRARAAARVVLAGPPNAGKSSLFNALLGRARSIVAAEPGTTRDYVEATIEVAGHGVVLVDTAGLRSGGAGAIEASGIERSQEQIAGADVVVWVEAADAADAVMPTLEGMVLRVESKRDVGERRAGWLGVSAPSGEGLDALRGALGRWFEAGGEESPWIGLARHRERASEAEAALAEALTELQGAAPLEIVAFQLAVAERRLAEITGRSALGPVGEDVLGRIFERFCIGK